MLTLLSGHTIGSKSSNARLLRSTSAFISGALITTALIVISSAYTAFVVLDVIEPRLAWACAAGLMIGLGIAVWSFYYRRSLGTSLWIPRGMARFLSDRTKATKHSPEAFSLGSASVFAELLFIMAPVTAAALAITYLPTPLQLVGALGYTVVASLPLVIVYILIGSGHKLSAIQRWRENNKRFMQFAAGSGLLILGFYIYVNHVLAPSIIIHRMILQ